MQIHFEMKNNTGYQLRKLDQQSIGELLTEEIPDGASLQFTRVINSSRKMALGFNYGFDEKHIFDFIFDIKGRELIYFDYSEPKDFKVHVNVYNKLGDYTVEIHLGGVAATGNHQVYGHFQCNKVTA